MPTRFAPRATTVAVAACLAVGTLTTATAAPAAESATATAPADWQAYSVARNGAVTVRLEVKPRATPADREFLRLVFHNGGDAPARVANAHYRIERKTFDLATGRGVSTGGLASGNDFDLFPRAWETMPISRFELAPGETYVVAEHPSEYSMALLGMPPAPGWRVEASAHLNLELSDGRKLDAPAAGVPFAFEWHHLDDQGVAALRARLRALVAEPPTRVTGNYVLSTLLNEPTVAGSLTVDELVAGLRGRTGGSLGGREHLAGFVNGTHRDDPKVIAYYREALSAGDLPAADDLAFLAPDVWADAFVVPLVEMAAKDGRNLYPALRALDRHAARWQGDAGVTGRLSAAVLAAHPLPAGDLVALDENRRHDLRTTIESLGLTRDRGAIRHLRSLLDSAVVLFDPTDPRLAMPATLDDGPVAPLRVRDAAATAILKILGRDEAATELLNADPKGPRAAGPDGQGLKARSAQQLAFRDERVAALRDELDKLPKDRD